MSEVAPVAPAAEPTAPAAEPTATSPSSPASSGPSLASLNDDALVRVKVDGKEVDVPWKQAREGVQFHETFTRRTQALAEERRQVAEQRAQFEQERAQAQEYIGNLRQALDNPQNLLALYMAKQAAAAGGAPQAPQPLTTADLQAQRAQMLTDVQQMLQQERAASEVQAAARQYETSMGTFVEGLLADQPLLKAVRGIEEVIFADAIAALPEKPTPDEAREALKQSIEARAAALSSAFTEQQKQSALAKNKAIHGIEPRGGAVQLPQARKYKGPDDPQRDKDFEAFVREMFSDSEAAAQPTGA
jgi:hypothetical protein